MSVVRKYPGGLANNISSKSLLKAKSSLGNYLILKKAVCELAAE